MNQHVLQSVDGQPLDPELCALVLAVDASIRHRPTDLGQLRQAMEALFAFLSSPKGGTDANCRATDAFFLEGVFDDGYWGHLPEPFKAILWDAGGQLHDTIDAPEIAVSFESTPQQSLARTRVLDV
jgi:hypothetical protein